MKPTASSLRVANRESRVSGGELTCPGPFYGPVAGIMHQRLFWSWPPGRRYWKEFDRQHADVVQTLQNARL